jgi:hypothetical protein
MGGNWLAERRRAELDAGLRSDTNALEKLEKEAIDEADRRDHQVLGARAESISRSEEVSMNEDKDIKSGEITNVAS